MTADTGFSGRGLQQSAEQWAERGRILTAEMAQLIHDYRSPAAATALDVGCQDGALIDQLATSTGLAWSGVDPGIDGRTQSPAGSDLRHGWAHDLGYPDQAFDVMLLANVFEHVSPDRRHDSFAEMRRVLKPGGIIVGQIPNPYFFVESHSRLPFMGWLPVPLQKRYWRLAPVPWEHNFYVVTKKHLLATAAGADLTALLTRNFNYPTEVIPESVQWAARALRPAMRYFPWAWQFVLRRPVENARA